MVTEKQTGTASVSQVYSPTGSPANISDGYTIHFTEGVTEIHDKVFANTRASRIEIADSVTVIGTDAFAQNAYDKSNIPDYIILGDNTRRIAFRAFMASVEKITPTTVEIGNVYQYEYDWVAVRRDVTFVARLSALRVLMGTIQELCRQQKHMYDKKVHRMDQRIVSLHMHGWKGPTMSPLDMDPGIALFEQ